MKAYFKYSRLNLSKHNVILTGFTKDVVHIFQISQEFAPIFGKNSGFPGGMCIKIVNLVLGASENLHKYHTMYHTTSNFPIAFNV